MQKIKENATYNPSVADPLDPVTFVHKIDVPTFMACQWERATGKQCVGSVLFFVQHILYHGRCTHQFRTDRGLPAAPADRGPDADPLARWP